MKLSFRQDPDPFYRFGWLIRRAMCVVGWHLWHYDWKLRVPYYGSGHEQCFTCGIVRVKP